MPPLALLHVRPVRLRPSVSPLPPLQRFRTITIDKKTVKLQIWVGRNQSSCARDQGGAGDVSGVCANVWLTRFEWNRFAFALAFHCMFSFSPPSGYGRPGTISHHHISLLPRSRSDLRGRHAMIMGWRWSGVSVTVWAEWRGGGGGLVRAVRAVQPCSAWLSLSCLLGLLSLTLFLSPPLLLGRV